MKKLWAILAGTSILLWLSLMQSRPSRAPVSPQSASAKDAPAAAQAPPPRAALPPPPAPRPVTPPPAALPQPLQAPQPVAIKQDPAFQPVPASDLIPLPPRRNDRPHFTAAQARAGNPGKILANAYAHEKPDPDWSPGAEADIRKAIAHAELARSQVFGVDCKSSVCKLQMRFSLPQREKFDSAFSKLHERFGTDLGFEPLTAMDNHGQQIVRVYVMREGKTLNDYKP